MSSPIVWDVSPVLFTLGPFTVRWYGVLFALGFALGYLIMRGMYRREGRPEADLDRLLLYVLAGTVIGARLGHVLFYDPGYYLTHPLQIPQVWKGGLASHGGLLGILLAVYLYSRRATDQPFLWVLDRLAVPTALAGAFIRLGNLFNSEILGTPADVPWAVVFARVDPVPRHPAQVYEALAYLLIFGVLRAVYRRHGAQTPRGLLLGLFLVLVFTARFLIEFVKVRQAAFGAALPLSMGQLLSLPAIAAGLLLLWHARRTAPAARP